MLINQAEKIYLGNQEAQKVYLGSQLLWALQPAPKGKELQKYVGHPKGKNWKAMQIGDKVTIRKGATKWLNRNFAQMEPMGKDYTGKTDTVERVADVKIGYSNKAYYLKNMKVWILEQDLVEPRQA